MSCRERFFLTDLQKDLSQMELRFRFQWMVGDTQALKKQLSAIAKPSWHYAVTVASRFVSYGAVFLVAWLLLPGEPFSTVLWIAIAASLSVYVSWGLSTYMGRKLEELTAVDSRYVGWNTVYLSRHGVTWHTDTSSDYTSWLGIESVSSAHDAIWMKTGQAQGIYLPPSAFGGELTQARTLEFIEAFRENAAPPAHVRIDGAGQGDGDPEKVLVKH